MFELIAAGVSLLGTIIFGLLAWGLKAEVKAMRTEVQLVHSGMQTELAQAENRFYQQINEVHLVRSEIQTELAQAENRFYSRVNGNYVRKEVHAEVMERLKSIEGKVDEVKGNCVRKEVLVRLDKIENKVEELE